MHNIGLLVLSILLVLNINAEKPLRQLTCENDTMFLRCPKGYTIAILTATYGKKDRRYCNMPGNTVNNCEAADAVDIVKYHCNRKQNCRIQTTNKVFGDPCVGTWKYLEVTYECMKGDILNAVACEHEKLKIDCPAGYYLWIVNALYGRTNQLTCYEQGRATRTNQCEATTALNVVEARCDNLKECSVDATNGMFGDPCLGTFKYLEVDYQCLDRGAI